MNRCNYCGIEILDDTQQCPLCQGVLEGENHLGHTYPDVVTGRRRLRFVYRLLVFMSIVATLICCVIDYKVSTKMNWSFIVAASLAYAMSLLHFLIKDNAGYRIRIIFGVAGGVVLIILLDVLTGFDRWSVNYVLPGAIILLDVALVVLMIVNKRNWQSYMILQIFMLLIGVLALVLCYKHVVTKEITTLVAFMATLILFLGTLILGGHTAKNELKRRFHI